MSRSIPGITEPAWGSDAWFARSEQLAREGRLPVAPIVDLTVATGVQHPAAEEVQMPQAASETVSVQPQGGIE